MENPILQYKTELIDWIKNLDDLEILSQLIILKEKEKNTSVAETKAEYLVKDDFEERFAKGLSMEESRAESKRRVREWWGK